MARWEQIIKEHHCGYGNKNTNYDALVREVPLRDEDLLYFEEVIREAATGGQASYDRFPEEGGIDIAAALLAEVRRLRT